MRLFRALTGAMLPVLVLVGCDQDLTMADQKKYHQWEKAKLFRNGRVAQVPVAGTVARGELDREARLVTRPPMSRELVERGRGRFDIFCSPCHGRLGDGRGMIVERGFSAPPSFHDERLRREPDEHFVDVITHGWGAMYAYDDRVPPEDRWAITAYIRALQLSQNTPVAELPDDVQRALATTP